MSWDEFSISSSVARISQRPDVSEASTKLFILCLKRTDHGQRRDKFLAAAFTDGIPVSSKTLDIKIGPECSQQPVPVDFRLGGVKVTDEFIIMTAIRW